jgi:hypothetical protein
MTTLHKSLVTVATVHGIDTTDILADCVESVETTLLAFKGESTLRRVIKKAQKDSDTLTVDDAVIALSAMREDNRSDRRNILKRAANMNRRQRALAVCAGMKGY